MRIGIVTGGGDCPGLNAVIRAVAKAATKRGWETLGIIGGYEGLLAPQNYRVLDYKALDGLLVRGGTILRTAKRGSCRGSCSKIRGAAWSNSASKRWCPWAATVR